MTQNNLATTGRELSYPIQEMKPRSPRGDNLGQLSWKMTGTIQGGDWITSAPNIVIMNTSGNVVKNTAVGVVDNAGAAILFGTATAPYFGDDFLVTLRDHPVATIQNSQDLIINNVVVTPLRDKVFVQNTETSFRYFEIVLSDTVATATTRTLEPEIITTTEYLEYRFRKLVNQWHSEAEDLSSITKIVTCQSYLSIMAMGPDAIPLILRQMESEGDDPDHWSAALRHMTGGENPIPEEAAGDTVKIAEAWLSWGRSRYAW